MVESADDPQYFIHTVHGGHLRLMSINQRSNIEKDFYYNEKVIENVN